MENVLISKSDLEGLVVLEEHKLWLSNWASNIDESIESGKISSSLCLVGCLVEKLLASKKSWDWLEVMDEYLVDEAGNPLAYSEAYGKQLYKFSGQWKQTPIHAIYTRWWIEWIFKGNASDKYVDLIEGFIQPNGWIYNPNVSPTNLNTRMKSEYFMSFAMGVHVLGIHDRLSTHKDFLLSTLANHPVTPYLSSEYFRILALEELGAIEHLPASIENVLLNKDTFVGFCDFSTEEKRDDYMGTQKRVSRDVMVPSAISTMHAMQIAEYMPETMRDEFDEKIQKFVIYLAQNPLDIPAFTIRDIVEIPFGPGITPLEIICATIIGNK